jgi:hypothetical protein
MKITLFWDVAACSLVDRCSYFRPTHWFPQDPSPGLHFHISLPFFYTLGPIALPQKWRRQINPKRLKGMSCLHIPEDGNLHRYRRENVFSLSSYNYYYYYLFI